MYNEENNNFSNNQPTPSTPVNNTLTGKYKLTLNRKKDFVGALVGWNVFIDNEKVGKLKNGETIILDVTSGNHIISFNKTNPINIQINGDTFADVVMYSTNNFGIDNINGQTNNTVPVANVEKSKKSANSLFITSIVLSIISIIGIFAFGFYIKEWFFALIIGYGIINLSGLKKLNDPETVKKIREKTIASMIIAAIMIIITIYISVNFGQ